MPRELGAVDLFPDRRVSPSLVVWDWVREVYPKTLAVRRVGDADEFPVGREVGMRAFRSTYEVAGCGYVVSQWTVKANGDWERISVDSALASPVQLDIHEWVFEYHAANSPNTSDQDRHADRIEACLRNVLISAAIGWYNVKVPRHEHDTRDVGLGQLLPCVQYNGNRLPVVGAGCNRDYMTWHPDPRKCD